MLKILYFFRYASMHDLESESLVNLIDFGNTMIGNVDSKRGFANIRARIRKLLRQDREALHKVMVALDVAHKGRAETLSTISKSEIIRVVKDWRICDLRV